MGLKPAIQRSAECYVHVLLDSGRGNRLPQGFVQKLIPEQVDGLENGDWTILEVGPGSIQDVDDVEVIARWRALFPGDEIENGRYFWETWDEVIQKAKIWWDGRPTPDNPDRKPYHLHTNDNGDVLLVRDDVVFHEELEEWRFDDQPLTLMEVIKLALAKDRDGGRRQHNADLYETIHDELIEAGFDPEQVPEDAASATDTVTPVQCDQPQAGPQAGMAPT